MKNKTLREEKKIEVKEWWKKTPNGVFRYWKIGNKTTEWLTPLKEIPFVEFKYNQNTKNEKEI